MNHFPHFPHDPSGECCGCIIPVDAEERTVAREVTSYLESPQAPAWN